VHTIYFLKHRADNEGRTTPGNHKSDVPFFNRNPQDWSIQAYLQSVTLPNEKTPIEILGRWKTALRQIQACKRYRCCNKDSRRRATELLEQYGRKVRLISSLDRSFSVYSGQPGAHYASQATFTVVWTGRAL
jgi:hypothetical protein